MTARSRVKIGFGWTSTDWSTANVGSTWRHIAAFRAPYPAPSSMNADSLRVGGVAVNVVLVVINSGHLLSSRTVVAH
jgi:hypothetical protein